jgi:hypothetical protein
VRLIKNLRVSNGLEELQGMREVLAFFSSLIIQWSKRKVQEPFALDQKSTDHLLQITNGSDLIDYFDLPAWFEAMEKECSMMDVFHHRTNPV